MDYHVNPRGEIGVCHASSSGRGCPFGDKDHHFATPQEARVSYEDFMEDVSDSYRELQKDKNFLPREPLPDFPPFGTEFQVVDSWRTETFQSLREALNFSKSNGYLEVVGFTQPWEDSFQGPWRREVTPALGEVPQELKEEVKNYWESSVEAVGDQWFNPDEANGFCTDSAEDFTAYLQGKGFDAYNLDLESENGPHTVTVYRDPSGGELVIDFTQRQFDSTAPVPFCQEKEDFLSYGGWEESYDY